VSFLLSCPSAALAGAVKPEHVASVAAARPRCQRYAMKRCLEAMNCIKCGWREVSIHALVPE
jgi:hypothetical protein